MQMLKQYYSLCYLHKMWPVFFLKTPLLWKINSIIGKYLKKMFDLDVEIMKINYFLILRCTGDPSNYFLLKFYCANISRIQYYWTLFQPAVSFLFFIWAFYSS